MTKSGYAKAEEARRRAQAQFAKPKSQEAKGLSDYEKAKQATAAKTVRLRAMRLEREAAEREASGGKPTKAASAAASSDADDETDDLDGDTAGIDGGPGFGDEADSHFNED